MKEEQVNTDTIRKIIEGLETILCFKGAETLTILLNEYEKLRRLDENRKQHMNKLLKISNQAWIWSTDDLIRFLESLDK